MKQKTRIPIDGEPVVWKSPFAVLKQMDLPQAAQRDTIDRPKGPRVSRSHIAAGGYHPADGASGWQDGHSDHGFVGVSQAEKEQLAKDMQKACGVGGR